MFVPCVLNANIWSLILHILLRTNFGKTESLHKKQDNLSQNVVFTMIIKKGSPISHPMGNKLHLLGMTFS